LFALYKLLGSKEQVATMRTNYEGGNYGYGHAKQAFFELLVKRFTVERERYTYFMNNLPEIDKALKIGAEKAGKVADEVLLRVRIKLGY
jgi:tryptophanyl-tRNA synthetase